MNDARHLSQETLDLLQLSALDGAHAAAARAHLEACERCRERFETLATDAKHFEQFVFPRTLSRVEATTRRAHTWSWKRPLVWVPATGLVAALAILLALRDWTGVHNPSLDELNGYIAVKGGPALSVYALRGSGAPFRVSPKARLFPGDRLRFVVQPARYTHVMVVSVDGAGAFSVYAPYGADESAPVAVGSGEEMSLPGSVELDATLGRETLTAFFSSRPLRAQEVEPWAVRTGEGPPTSDAVQTVSLDFEKVEP
jgi:hypothetical protein